MKGLRGFRDFVKLNLVIVFGVVVISNIFVAGLIGYLIDKWTFNNKVIFIIFLFIGVISGIYNGIRELLREAERYEKLDKKDGNGDDNTAGN